jgi:hypothetical protein
LDLQVSSAFKRAEEDFQESNLQLTKLQQDFQDV